MTALLLNWKTSLWLRSIDLFFDTLFYLGVFKSIHRFLIPFFILCDVTMRKSKWIRKEGEGLMTMVKVFIVFVGGGFLLDRPHTDKNPRGDASVMLGPLIVRTESSDFYWKSIGITIDSEWSQEGDIALLWLYLWMRKRLTCILWAVYMKQAYLCQGASRVHL